jgi:hypothetical protein
MNAAPVSAEDVDLAVDLAVSLLRRAETDAWDYRAGTLKWTCWETVEHIADDLFAYAAQMGPRLPPLEGHVPFVCEPRRSGGPASTIFAEREAGPEGLIQVLEASAALLSAMVRTVPPGSPRRRSRPGAAGTRPDRRRDRRPPRRQEQRS